MVLKKTFQLELSLVIPPFFIEFYFFFYKILKVFAPCVKLQKSVICCPVNSANFLCLVGCSSDDGSQHVGGASPGLDFPIPAFHSIPLC